MKMKATIIAIVCLLALGLTAPVALADSLVVGDGHYLGRINDDIPSSVALETGYLNNLITLAAGAGPIQIPPGTGEIYDRLGSTLAGPFPTAFGGVKSGDDPAYTGINVTGYTYILGKYDADKAGGYVWDVSGLTTVDIPQNLPLANKYGLSHYTLFNPSTVPDGGVTLMLLGGALVGLETLRRRFRA
jgi:hypothetical protein